MDNLLFIGFLLLLVLIPVGLILADVINMVRHKERPVFELAAFGMGGIYMCFAYFLWDLPDYTQSLNYYGTQNAHEPFNLNYGFSLLLFAFFGFFSYYILKFFRKKLSPLAEVFCLAGMYVGCGLSLAFMIQLLCGARPEQPVDMPGAKFSMWVNPFDLVEICCLCIVPFIFLLHALQLQFLLVKEKAKKQEELHYTNGLLNRINLWLLKGANLFPAAVAALLPVLLILVMILVLFGQQPDSILLAFTKTSDWILSGEISPPPVAYDAHYLCTVSLRGHKKLVKPLRYGLRRGEKIVVNRQLCVANAFEELIMEKTPRFHKAVRDFYDTYGYPISKHINSAVSADITYLIMKPLEWIFVLVLYLFDKQPENRIAGQYLPKGVRKNAGI